MAYKKIEYGFSFADIAIKAYSDKNRNLLFLREVESTIDWQPVQDLLIEYYEPGKSKAGEEAYPPLLIKHKDITVQPFPLHCLPAITKHFVT